MQARPSLQTGAVSAMRPWPAYVLVWIAFAVLVMAVLATRGIVSSIYTHDLYVAFDGGWRTYLGQRPYVDFHSPIGFAYYLPYELLKKIEPFSLLTLMHANVLVALVYLVLANMTLPRRLTPLYFFLVTFGAITVVISPRAADWWPTVFSHLAPYNRWGEGAMMLVAPLVLVAPRSSPPDGRGWRQTPDVAAAVVLAAFLFLLFHVKVTYCLCSLGLVAIGLATRQIAVSTVAVAAGLCLVAAGVTELALHLHRPYLADLEMARQATLEEFGKFRANNRRVSTYMMAGYLAIVALLLKLDAPGESFHALLMRRRQILFIAIGGMLVAAVENTQRHGQIEIPMMGSVLIVAAQLIQRRPGSTAAARPGANQRFLSLVLLGSLPIPLVETAAIVDHMLVSRSSEVCPVPAWKGTPGEKLLFAKSDMVAPGESTEPACDQIRIVPRSFQLVVGDQYETKDSARVEVARLTEAETLLKGRVVAKSRIVAIDFASPYSVFTATVPTSGALLWWDLGRNYAAKARPDPVAMFRNVDYVLESIYDPPLEPHGAHMWGVYGAQVSHDFQNVAEGRLWRLWARRPAP
jgi:hypothetical protein